MAKLFLVRLLFLCGQKQTRANFGVKLMTVYLYMHCIDYALYLQKKYHFLFEQLNTKCIKTFTATHKIVTYLISLNLKFPLFLWPQDVFRYPPPPPHRRLIFQLYSSPVKNRLTAAGFLTMISAAWPNCKNNGIIIIIIISLNNLRHTFQPKSLINCGVIFVWKVKHRRLSLQQTEGRNWIFFSS